MSNKLSIAPFNFDTELVARCDTLPEDALHSVCFNSMRHAEVWRLKKSVIQNWKWIASVKRKESAEKQTRGLRPRKRFTLPAKLLK